MNECIFCKITSGDTVKKSVEFKHIIEFSDEILKLLYI